MRSCVRFFKFRFLLLLFCPNHMIVTVKEVMQLFNCSQTTALHHMQKIRKTQKTEYITKWHIADYLNIDFYALAASWEVIVNGDFVAASALIKLREMTKGINLTQKEFTDRIHAIMSEVEMQRIVSGLAKKH